MTVMHRRECVTLSSPLQAIVAAHHTDHRREAEEIPSRRLMTDMSMGQVDVGLLATDE